MSSLDSAAERARAHWNIDGLPEMLWSIFFLLLALHLIVNARPSPIWVEVPVTLLFSAVLLTNGWLFPKILERLKARWTYPRTGYVPAPPSAEELRDVDRESLSIRPKRATNHGASLALWLPQYQLPLRLYLFSGFVLLLAMDFWSFRWAPLVLALAATGAFYGARVHPELLPFHPLVLLSLPLSGLLLSLFEITVRTRFAWVLVGAGTTGLLAGAVTLWRFLQQYPRAELPQ